MYVWKLHIALAYVRVSSVILECALPEAFKWAIRRQPFLVGLSLL
jgi:hypothetical protein